nr:MAG TPA: hypothetical protein [Caudoviricetes sp.]
MTKKTEMCNLFKIYVNSLKKLIFRMSHKK